ncbi:DUF2238 domain-containing protein [Novosphingobium sp. JCM 18896]|uniref:DUF2238 domain-containing protein n=1 Tax=Novosphingobium sp. JCM 18896 TaxID=2989731 RepID=UPI002221A70D|nr:DUF2238 domain-containing protein [Novosphingobium sp. JCM 18896]MCW1430931.1 DUF2238 domain-containing protein [Novosphingobium sp. JCM 18896]
MAWLGVTALGALLSLFDTPFPKLAPMQNLPTLLVVAALAGSLRRWPLPSSVVACLAIFLMLHTLGGRYIYSYVPYDDWVQALGLPKLSDVFGFRRNHYDRLVHFSFGLLLVHPIATMLRRYAGVGARLSLYIAVEFIFAASALYEIFEWMLTMLMAGADADAYNGQQGDVWDAQKDMACAGCGALLTAIWLRLRR